MLDIKKYKLQIVWDALHEETFDRLGFRALLNAHIRETYNYLFTEEELNNKCLRHNKNFVSIHFNYIYSCGALVRVGRGKYILNEDYYNNNVFEEI